MSRTVLVTGASQGIGLAIAQRLAADGWNIVNLDMSAPRDGAPGEWYEVDLSDADALQVTLDDVLSAHNVDALVNNAGISQSATLEETTDETFDLTVAINLRAPMICARALAQGMKERGFGRIVNISSRAHLGKTHRTAYAAAKGGVLSMAKVWALEYAAYGVTCNVIAPGPIRTELFERANPRDMPRTQEIVGMVPVGRLGEPEDIANSVAFFLDERSGFVTGQTLYVCGGITLARSGN
ncbi:MAG: 3-oxoacyl-[acyl-carrier protein] reductase [Gammaproteobacteria bacterium]